MLTGNKDVDYMNLNLLDDKSLGKIFQLNREAREISYDDDFWKRRILHIFKGKSSEILKEKREGESYRQFYQSKRFGNYKEKLFPICTNISKLPHKSRMVIDEFYNSTDGFYKSWVFYLDYLILKVVLSKMRKENLSGQEKVEELIRKNVGFDTLDLTEKNIETFKNYIQTGSVGYPAILRSASHVRQDFVRRLPNPPAYFRFINFIHLGIANGNIPLDITWDELCSLPYLFTDSY